MKLKHNNRLGPAAKAARHGTKNELPSEGVVLPSPENLLALAINEADRRILDDYTDTIRVLRDEKRFTFREIAQWLKQHGIKTDHNTIYRAYRKMLPAHAAEELDQEMALEQNEQKG
jgi:hypothetical protein